MKRILSITTVAALLGLVTFGIWAASSTVNMTKSRVNSTNIYSTAEFTIAGTDTVIVPFTSDDDFGTLLVGTRGNGDSTDIGIRYQFSFDNSNFGAVTLGTDSTTWVSALSAGLTVNSIALSSANHAPAPYKRLMVVGLTGNDSTVVKIIFQPTSQ